MESQKVFARVLSTSIDQPRWINLKIQQSWTAPSLCRLPFHNNEDSLCFRNVDETAEYVRNKQFEKATTSWSEVEDLVLKLSNQVVRATFFLSSLLPVMWDRLSFLAERFAHQPGDLAEKYFFNLVCELFESVLNVGKSDSKLEGLNISPVAN